jgi:hypothetical protein
MVRRRKSILELLDIGAIPPPSTERLKQSYYVRVLARSGYDEAQLGRKIQLFGGHQVDATRPFTRIGQFRLKFVIPVNWLP